jgi:hypothetical protein
MDLAFMELPLMSFPTTLADLVLVLGPDPDPRRKRQKIDPDLLHQKERQVLQEKEEALQDLEVHHLNKRMVAVPEVYQPKSEKVY